MPSFLARNLARIFALSQMENDFQPSMQSNSDYVAEGVNNWNKYMRWLIPFAKASGLRIVIENSKSHEKIVIDKDTTNFPRLSSSWLKRYDKQELDTWITNEDKKERARKIAEKRGRAKFGEGYKASNEDIQDVLNK